MNSHRSECPKAQKSTQSPWPEERGPARRRSHQAAPTVALTLAALLIGGCLERKETIRITPLGGAHVELEYRGEPQQFETADALPSAKAGWAVQRTVSLDDNGKEEVTLVASRKFEPREDLAANYASKDDPDAQLYLQFPTSLQIDRRPDAVYLHFRRVYASRAWAFVQFWQDQFVDDDIKKRAEKPVEEMSPEDRVRIVRAFAGFEFFKQLELFESAVRRLDTPIAQDVWLAARQAVLEKLESTDWDVVVAELVAAPEEQRDEKFEAASRALLEESHRAFLNTLAQHGVGEEQRARLATDFARASKSYRITAETGGHAFQIRVHMPGEVVAHNADKVDDDGAAVWEFSGEAFRDRPYELMITAKLPRG